MKVTVDTKLCAEMGQCVFSAPEVFAFNDNGKLVWESNPDLGLRDAVDEAADVCPVQAIFVEHD
ncbi:ferredoxin [Paenarthrobacter sp. NEAU-H11]|uniref:ferredoxin n=1 Tax=Paenarthrobacter sp. NEAU-H11 TaxID=3423924 RepID=UPI003D32C328